MKIQGKLFTVVAVSVILLLAFSGIVFGQEERKIKMDEYKAELAGLQARETTATTEAGAIQKEIDALKAQIAEVQGQIDATWGEIYAALGTDKAGVKAFGSNLDALDAQLNGLDALSAEDLFRSSEELDAIVAKIEEAKTSKIALLTEMEDKIAALELKVANLKAKMPPNIFDQYTVINGDNLWKISKKEYEDAMQWIRIYCVNKDQIKNPDLIFPEQVFNIARGVGKNEHLVVKGEYLSKIAGLAKVFNDPTKWTKLYEANKDMINDPNIVYPYQVLTVPAE